MLSLHRIALMLLAPALLTPSAVSAQECPPDWTPAFEVDRTLYPFTDRCFDSGSGLVHYFDEGPTAHPPKGTVLMLHGNPTWSFLYRDIALGLLNEGYRTIGVDFLGFGLSDKPDPDGFTYSARSHADVMADFIEGLDLTNITLMMQDWGGPIGLHAAARMPERIDACVILNTWAWVIHNDLHPYFHHAADWQTDNVVNSEFYLTSGTVPRGVGNTLAGLYGPPGSPEFLAVRNAYWGPFLDLKTGEPLSRDAMQPTNRFYPWMVKDPSFMEEVELALDTMANKPAAFLFGEQDKWFGTLICDETRVPTCPDDLVCERVDGRDLCLDNGEKVYPALSIFLSRWNPDAVAHVEISPTGGHFVQEYESAHIIEATLQLRRWPRPAAAQP